MASAIDATKPVAGSPTTQSVRDNFAIAASEITALQALTVTPPYSVANGGTGRNSLTANRPLVGNGTSAVTLSTAMAINTGVVIGNPAPDPGQGGLVLNANAATLPLPGGTGTMLQICNVDGLPARVLLDGFGVNASGNLTFRRANGTAAAPSALLSGDTIMGIPSWGYGATGYGGTRAYIGSMAAQNWTDVAQGTALVFNTTLNGSITNTEAMRIDHNGNVGIGTTAPTEKLSVSGQAAAGLNASAVRSGPNGADATTSLINFQSFDKSVTIGGIVRSGTNQVSYITTSDERLKDGIKASERGLDALMAIKVSDYKMGKTASQGLLAQDVAKVYPEAVHEGGKDPNLQPWMLDYGRLTPLLIKGMQQQQEMIAALQAKVAALESATVH